MTYYRAYIMKKCSTTTWKEKETNGKEQSPEIDPPSDESLVYDTR